MYVRMDFLRRTRFLHGAVLSTSWVCVWSRSVTSMRRRWIVNHSREGVTVAQININCVDAAGDAWRSSRPSD